MPGLGWRKKSQRGGPKEKIFEKFSPNIKGENKNDVSFCRLDFSKLFKCKVNSNETRLQR
jgi:hypothetical protein